MAKRLISLVLCLLLLGGCNTTGTAGLTPEQELAGAAKQLLSQALDVIFLYEGEMPTNKEAAPYYAPNGRKYYPTSRFGSLAALRTHSRMVFTESFCQNVLDPAATDPEQPRFVEREGKLWETKSVGSMGWIDSLIPNTIEVVSLEGERGIVSGYSQSMLGTVTRQDFLLIKEADGWRMDSYYDLNKTLETEALPTIKDFVRGLANDDDTIYRATITTPGSTAAVELPESMITTFDTMLAALEYDPASVHQVDEIPQSALEEPAMMGLRIYSGDCELSGFTDGRMYITATDGSITELQLAYPAGMSMLVDLMKAAKWQLNKFKKSA